MFAWLIIPSLSMCILSDGKSENLQQNANKGYSIGSFISSRFIVATISMLTMEHQLVDLTLLLNHGLLGLTQALIRLTASVQQEEHKADEKDVVSRPVETAPPSPKATPTTGSEVIHKLKTGVKVVRGPDWKWDNQVTVETNGYCYDLSLNMTGWPSSS